MEESTETSHISNILPRSYKQNYSQLLSKRRNIPEAKGTLKDLLTEVLMKKPRLAPHKSMLLIFSL